MSETSGANRRVTLAAVASGNFAQLGARFLLSPIVPLVLVEFDATKSGVGVALTGMWATYALFQFPSGVLSDRYGERTLVLAGLAGTAAGTALLAFSPSLLAFGAFTLVLGAGTGVYFSPASSLLSRLYETRGAALGVLTAAGAVAGVVYPAIGSQVGVRFGWRLALALGAAVALPTLAACAWLIPTIPPANPERTLRASLDPQRIRGLLSRPSLAYTTLLAVLVGFTFQAITSFFPTFLVQFRGLDTATAGVAFGAVFGLSSLSQPLAGRLSDAASRDLAIGLSVVLTAVGLATLLAVPGVAGLVAGTVVVGVGLSWPGPMQARFHDCLSDEERGFGFGLVRTVYMFLAAPGSVVVGVLADTGGWVWGYGVVVVVLSACVLALVANRALDAGL